MTTIEAVLAADQEQEIGTIVMIAEDMIATGAGVVAEGMVTADMIVITCTVVIVMGVVATGTTVDPIEGVTGTAAYPIEGVLPGTAADPIEGIAGTAADPIGEEAVITIVDVAPAEAAVVGIDIGSTMMNFIAVQRKHGKLLLIGKKFTNR